MIGAILAAFLAASPVPDTVADFVMPKNVSTGSAPLDFVVQLEVVNEYVNSNCVFTDQGPTNPWGRCSLKDWKGNCKDFALEKRAELIIAGIEPKRMKIWYVMVPVKDIIGDGFHFNGHAVLVVDGTWVLDNRFTSVTHRGFQEAHGYQFICAVPDRNLYDGPSKTTDPARCTEK